MPQELEARLLYVGEEDGVVDVPEPVEIPADWRRRIEEFESAGVRV